MIMIMIDIKIKVSFILHEEKLVTYHVTSQYVKNLMQDYRLSEMEVVVPTKYHDVFLNYFNYLSSQCEKINNLKTLLLCFDMETYFDDQQYFQYLIQCAYWIWFEFHPHISSLVNERDIYLYSPYEFLPDNYKDNKQFFKEWRKMNENKMIEINGVIYRADITHPDHDQDKDVIGLYVCQIINGEEVGYAKEWIYYNDDQIKKEIEYFNGKRHGVKREWYNNGQVELEGEYLDDEKHGLWKSWHENGKPKTEGQYEFALKQGVWRYWDEDGQFYDIIYDMIGRVWWDSRSE